MTAAMGHFRLSASGTKSNNYENHVEIRGFAEPLTPVSPGVAGRGGLDANLILNS